MKNLIVRHSDSSVIITTECKRQRTAINRFSKFLADYDREFTEFMLKCFMSLAPVYNHDGICGYKSKYWCKDYSCELLAHDNVYMLVLDFSETIGEKEMPFFESGLNYSDSDTSDSDSDISDSDSDISDSDSDTSDSDSDTSDSDSDTSDSDSDTTTIILGSLDDVQTDIYMCPEISFSSDTSDTNEYTKDIKEFVFYVRKHSIVKPVPFSSSFLEVRTGGEYPFKIVLSNGSEMWDCRSRVYNEYLANLIGSPPYDELPF